MPAALEAPTQRPPSGPRPANPFSSGSLSLGPSLGAPPPSAPLLPLPPTWGRGGSGGGSAVLLAVLPPPDAQTPVPRESPLAGSSKASSTPPALLARYGSGALTPPGESPAAQPAAAAALGTPQEEQPAWPSVAASSAEEVAAEARRLAEAALLDASNALAPSVPQRHSSMPPASTVSLPSLTTPPQHNAAPQPHKRALKHFRRVQLQLGQHEQPADKRARRSAGGAHAVDAGMQGASSQQAPLRLCTLPLEFVPSLPTPSVSFHEGVAEQQGGAEMQNGPSCWARGGRLTWH